MKICDFQLISNFKKILQIFFLLYFFILCCFYDLTFFFYHVFLGMWAIICIFWGKKMTPKNMEKTLEFYWETLQQQCPRVNFVIWRRSLLCKVIIKWPSLTAKIRKRRKKSFIGSSTGVNIYLCFLIFTVRFVTHKKCIYSKSRIMWSLWDLLKVITLPNDNNNRWLLFTNLK